MEGVLPEEFPFSRREAEARRVPALIPAPAPVPGPVVAPAPENIATTQANEPAARAVAARVEHLDEEPLVEVASSGRVLYRGRERRRSPRQALRAKAVYRDEMNIASSGPVQVLNISM